MSDGPWEQFCIVGFGGHARTKLAPAIKANGQVLAGSVSRGGLHAAEGAPCFRSVADAIRALPSEVCFLISSPPAVHFEQVCAVLEAGRDVLVEKPAFVNASQVRAVEALARERGCILGELFMHRHTELYRRFKAEWSTVDATRLDVTFVVPSLPAGTFRTGPKVADSSLYDIGCYVLSLLEDIGFPVGSLALKAVEQPASPLELIELRATSPLTIKATIGVCDAYANRVTLTSATGATTYEPFFYGRAGERRITRSDRVYAFQEPNAFETMLRIPRSQWRDDQLARIASMLSVTTRLQELGEDLVRKRND